MRDFTKLKGNLKEAAESLSFINEVAQTLPDEAEMPETGSPIYETLQILIQGFTEFKPYHDAAYEPFKDVVEKILKENGTTPDRS